MNQAHAVGLIGFIPRILAVLAAVALLCHVDLLFNSVSTEEEADPNNLNIYRVHTPEDTRAKRLASFIQTRFKTNDHVAEAAATAAIQASRETGLPATLILAVAGVESSFKPHSDNGADKGIMQVNPKWHPKKVAAIGGPSKLFEVAPGIKTGARILKEYMDASKQDVVVTLLRYNGATNYNEYPDKVLAEKRRFDQALAMNVSYPVKLRCKDASSGCYTPGVKHPNRDPI
jgi:soluble lytic murein transglycosylase-like protein